MPPEPQGDTDVTELPTDGRLNRSTKTRAKIVEALFTLIQEGNLLPTSHEVATRASVGHRTVFRHFEDMETLYEEIRARTSLLLRPAFQTILVEGTLEERIVNFVELRVGFYEKAKFFMRAGLARQWESPSIQENQTNFAKELRKNLIKAFPEARKAGADIQNALDQATSFEAWERLRVRQGLSAKSAQRAMTASIRALLKS